MKVLVTGATGFLGKATLSLLVSSDTFEQIIVITRSKKTHPSEKVKVVKGDLTDPQCLKRVSDSIDAVIHIAGLYDFGKGYAENYLHNVVATSQVVAWIKNLPRPVPIHFISTYAVGAGRWSSHEPEGLQKTLPEESRHYAFSKSMAEHSIARSGLPYVIYRPGIIVGDSVQGKFENLNGPYYILKLLSNLNRSGLLAKLPAVPIPAHRDAFLPLVPVDLVAQVIAEGVKDQNNHLNKVYGIYDESSTTCAAFMDAVKAHWGLNFRPVFVQEFPRRLLRLQRHLTKIPPEVFLFANEVRSLSNPIFLSDFPNHRIPTFETYKEVFFEGFERMNGVF